VQCAANKFPIKGFIETSFIDWKGHLSSVLFSGGCNFRCPYCHNSGLVLNPRQLPGIPLKRIMSSLKKFANWVDRVVVTGGEPTIHAGLTSVLEALKNTGMHVKLDTNGSSPDLVRRLASEGLIDAVSMDIKGPLDRYARWAGVDVDREPIEESIRFLLEGRVDYEFRMTVVPFLHREEDVYQVAQMIGKAKRFTIQTFKPNNTLDPSFSSIRPFTPDRMAKIRQNVSEILAESVQPSASNT
jgi:pyruvate formate lyase activating enzyme